MEFYRLSLRTVQDLINKKEISQKEVLKSILGRINQVEKQLNAFITIFDYELDFNSYNTKFLPIAIKDNICIKGKRTTCGSKILENYIAPYDATVIEFLRSAGAVFIGKTNMDEFAMGSSTETSYFGITRNPYDLSRIPGGSSGGSAVAVASGEVPVALGSDTGGSIRQPAALCGVVGMKPTYGRVSRYGLVAFASSLDQIGVFARNVYDCAIVAEIICQYDDKDSTCVNLPQEKFTGELQTVDENFIKNIKIGIPKEYFIEGIQEEIRQKIFSVIEFLSRSGAKIEEVSLPHTEYAVATYYIIAPSEASSNLARYDGVKYGYKSSSKTEDDYPEVINMYRKTRQEGFGAEVKRRIMLGTYSLSSGYYDAYYLKAQKVRKLIFEDFMRVFNKVDFIIAPTTPTTAFKLGEKINDPLQMYLSDIFTIPCNLAGLPGMSIPCGYDNQGLPIGLQLIAPHFKESNLLKLAHFIELNFKFEKIKNEYVV
ncbi:MAG: Asp-tRNA(Asn)/Glu-tRNA(Gln) amidotransferase subunit GatA [Endomicrobia bacterium]|nr:Asp-tRNA(Asn)/Glu-tRNA(Gln) amidotransferase subunit GatA [Endomicrobiia bacterium]MDW8055165.1 Asp-tRNA(Asn)/Glu-tRNA(Gln) amidotransferase subunit GatA [Elusimicrobiota bacterium]